MLIGHGSFDGFDYKFNLPGPDLSGVELAALLDQDSRHASAGREHDQRQRRLACGARKANRVVITATKTGTEKNATVFARYWVEALRDPAADTDKNETVSALEAFNYAEQKTAQFYETQKRLATEHPVLEDTGKGEGARKPSPENGEGLLASHFTLLRFGAAQIGRQRRRKRRRCSKSTRSWNSRSTS